MCPICKSKNQIRVWNNKIRDGKNSYSKNKIKIFFCLNCETRYKLVRSKKYLDNVIFRKKYDGEASIKKYHSFNENRELNKFKIFFKKINFKNKKVLEHNCGGGSILKQIQKKTKFVAGVDSFYYKDYLTKNRIDYFANINQIIKENKKFDIILSLGEIEHKYDPVLFLKRLRKILKKNGLLIVRIPNFDNIYRFTLNDIFLKDDYRTSHNFYFNENSLDYLFKKVGFKTIDKSGLQEYSINNFLSYLKFNKRPENKEINFFNSKIDKLFKKNLENTLTSTSLLYILNKNVQK